MMTAPHAPVSIPNGIHRLFQYPLHATNALSSEAEILRRCLDFLVSVGAICHEKFDYHSQIVYKRILKSIPSRDGG